MSKLILSIDGGGSTTKAGFIEAKSNKIVKEIKYPKPFNFNAFIKGTYKDILQNILKEGKPEHIVMGIAGADSEHEKKQMCRDIYKRL